jgi:hypothetical protein
MLSRDIPYTDDPWYNDFQLNDLMDRVEKNKRAWWTDIAKSSGIYVLYVPQGVPVEFQASGSAATFADLTSTSALKTKWSKINSTTQTDILYIGKAVSLKKRISALIRFGLGRCRNHHGGEWVWQVKMIREMRISINSCPKGKEAPYEKWLLDEFHNDHEEYPLANRQGGDGIEIWNPTMLNIKDKHIKSNKDE